MNKENPIKDKIDEIARQMDEINAMDKESNKRVNWYGIFPYTEIVKTNDEYPYLFALLLNDKLVAIGGEYERQGGVFPGYDLVFKTWLEFKKTLGEIHRKAEYVNNVGSQKILGRGYSEESLRNAEMWLKLFELIKGKKYIGRRELPPQPQQLLYRTTQNGDMYIIYENRWKRPNRFALWSGREQKYIGNSSKLSDMTEQLSRIVGRQITIIQ